MRDREGEGNQTHTQMPTCLWKQANKQDKTDSTGWQINAGDTEENTQRQYQGKQDLKKKNSIDYKLASGLQTEHKNSNNSIQK